MDGDVILSHGLLTEFRSNLRCLYCQEVDRKCIIQRSDLKCLLCADSTRDCVFRRIIAVEGIRTEFTWEQMQSKRALPPVSMRTLSASSAISKLVIDTGDGKQSELNPSEVGKDEPAAPDASSSPARPVRTGSLDSPPLMMSPVSATTSTAKSHYPCLLDWCKASFTRPTDIVRHMSSVHGNGKIADCPFSWCGRVGPNGFNRRDHLKNHLKEVHALSDADSTKELAKIYPAEKEAPRNAKKRSAFEMNRPLLQKPPRSSVDPRRSTSDPWWLGGCDSCRDMKVKCTHQSSATTNDKEPVTVNGPPPGKMEISQFGYRRPNRSKVYCNQCEEAPDGFRSEHELRRHVERLHTKVRKVWICVDSSPDQSMLATCKSCRTQKPYGAYYNAAAHLRRVHFNPTTRGKKRSGKDPRAGRIRADDPSMEVLKQHWMKEIEERVPNNLEDSPVSSPAREELEDEEDESPPQSAKRRHTFSESRPAEENDRSRFEGPTSNSTSKVSISELLSPVTPAVSVN